MTAPFYRFGKQGFVAKSARFYWHAACRVRRPDAPMPRKRHEIFAKVYLTDRRDELRSPLNFLWFSDNALRIDQPLWLSAIGNSR